MQRLDLAVLGAALALGLLALVSRRLLRCALSLSPRHITL
jgi:hypothetical protein